MILLNYCFDDFDIELDFELMGVDVENDQGGSIMSSYDSFTNKN